MWMGLSPVWRPALARAPRSPVPVLGPVWAAGVVAASRAGELAGNGVVAVLRPGVAVGTACGVSVGCGACAAVSSPVEVVVPAATGAVLVASRLECPREKTGIADTAPSVLLPLIRALTT